MTSKVKSYLYTSFYSTVLKRGHE